jgi:hypothetical protein
MNQSRDSHQDQIIAYPDTLSWQYFIHRLQADDPLQAAMVVQREADRTPSLAFVVVLPRFQAFEQF